MCLEYWLGSVIGKLAQCLMSVVSKKYTLRPYLFPDWSDVNCKLKVEISYSTVSVSFWVWSMEIGRP